MSWHGLWTWEDRGIFGYDWYDFDNPEPKSAWISLLVGTLLSLFMIFAQFPLTRCIQSIQNQENENEDVEFGYKTATTNYSKVQKILGRILIRGLVFVYNVIGLVATVNTFRGYWYLFDNYFEVNHDFLTGTSHELLRQTNHTANVVNAEDRKYISYPKAKIKKK